MSTRRYQVTHSTIYGYSDVVTSSYGRGFLTPRDTARQRCLSHTLTHRPRGGRQFHQPGRLRQRQLVLPCHRAAPQALHHQRVGRRGRTRRRRAVRRRFGVGAVGDRPTRRSRRCAGDGVHPRPAPPEITDEVRDYAAPSFAPGRPLIEVLRDLTSRIYRDFTYRSGSTTVSTQVNDVLAAREGVCQDFARLAIACLRANGLAASYVSGYLATDPPPGKERMVGIDATHAWASVWTPQNQWLGLDPTNDQMVDERYIIVGWGRDYADVPPLRGIIYTDSESSVIDVAVDVAPLRRRSAACVTSSVPSAASTWRSRTRCACPATARWVSRCTTWRCWSSRQGDESAQPGFVDADKYELCANLHLAECNWLVEKSPVRKLCTSCALTRTRPNDADTTALGGVRRRGEGQTPAHRRTVRAEAADHRA